MSAEERRRRAEEAACHSREPPEKRGSSGSFPVGALSTLPQNMEPECGLIERTVVYEEPLFRFHGCSEECATAGRA